jgi:hypothetical protein
MRDNTLLNGGAEVHKFVEEYVDSFISWDILLFFYNNPGALESSESLSNRLGRNEKDVSAGLRALATKGVLLSATKGIYQSNPDPQFQARVKAFNDALSIAPTRLSILNQVLSKGRTRYEQED